MSEYKKNDTVELLEDVNFNYSDGVHQVATKGDKCVISHIDDEGIWLNGNEFYVDESMIKLL